MKFYFTLLSFLVSFILAFAQVGINTENPKGILDIESKTNGVMFPRMYASGIKNIQSTKEGMIVYSISDKTLFVYNGNSWDSIEKASYSQIDESYNNETNTEWIFRIFNAKHSDALPSIRAIAIDDNDTNKIRFEDIDNNQDQYWVFEKLPNGNFRIVNYSDRNKVLSTDVNSNIILQAVNSSNPRQEWIIANDNSEFRIINAPLNKGLQHYGGNGSITLETILPYTNQMWGLKPITP